MKILAKQILASALMLFVFISPLLSEIKENSYGAYSFEIETELPGNPEIIYDAITGDISGWWDHSFSEKPYKFYIEPKPGGGFWEYFNDKGEGVLHATVIAAQRGKLLRFDGPLGLAGNAVQVVTTYQFSAAGQDSTTLKVSVNMAGEIDRKMAGIVQSVWRHFIIEQFTPYVERGDHLRAGMKE